MTVFQKRTQQTVYIDQCMGRNNRTRSTCARGVTEKAKFASEKEFGKVLCWTCIENQRDIARM